MPINFTLPETVELKPRIVVIGVGGAGGNAVNNMIAAGLDGVDFIVANTDAQALALNAADRKVQMGSGITQGLGAGMRPEVGEQSAEEALDEILEHLDGAHMLFVAAGYGRRHRYGRCTCYCKSGTRTRNFNSRYRHETFHV